MTLGGPSPSWFRQHFNDDYLTIYSGRDLAQAETEVELVTRELSITPEDRVLDLCCGFGRHLEAFARRGITAWGVDLSLPLLRRVKKSAASARGRGGIVCADMRALPFAGGKAGFSVVVNFFTSFGYFESDAENYRAVEEIGRVLQPGGRYAMDLLNAESAVRSLVPRTERTVDGFRLVEERSFDAGRRRIEKKITLSREDASAGKQYFESVRVFSPDEITRLLDRAGLRVDELLGDFSGRPFGADTTRMIVLGSKGDAS